MHHWAGRYFYENTYANNAAKYHKKEDTEDV